MKRDTMLHTVPLTDITIEHLSALVDDKVAEGLRIDYKRDLKLASDHEKREFCRDVASFANAAGGDLVLGAEEAKNSSSNNLGYPSELLGIDEATNLDALKLRLENICRDLIEPRVPGLAFCSVGSFSRGPVVIVRVPRSWRGPHLVRPQNSFYSRNSAGKQPLDIHELRTMFIAGSELEVRPRRFRDERIGRIIAAETPLPLVSEARPKLVVHIVPISFGDQQLDLHQIQRDSSRMPPLGDCDGWSTRFNIDGLVRSTGAERDGQQRCYAQAFRDGCYEGVNVLYVDGLTPVGLHALEVEKYVINSVRDFRSVLGDQCIAGPVAVLISLLGVRGLRVRGQEKQWSRGVHHETTIDRDVLLLPDVLVDDQESELVTLFRPAFDALWQASGWPRSQSYDENGQWLGGVHRRLR
jgi:hypothetical protein